MKAISLKTKISRDKLPPRPAPYFQSLDQGQSLGLRKNLSGHQWVARLLHEGKYESKILQVDEQDPQKEFGTALRAAQEWFSLRIQGVKVEYTLKDAVTDYLAYLQAEKSITVWKTCKEVLEKIPKGLQKIPVHQLATRKLDQWRTSFVVNDGDADTLRRSQNTSNRRWSDLRACLNRAFQMGYVIDKSAWERIKPYGRVQRGRQIFWTVEEAQRLLHSAYTESVDFGLIVEAGLLTGCRIGELKALRASDFDGETLNIADSKTGHRQMFLSSPAIKFFKKLSKNKTPRAWIFTFQGRPWTEDRHHKLFRQVRGKSQINEESTFYCCRHFYISRALESGISVELISKNVGTSPDMIFKFYGKFTARAQREAVNIAGEALGF